MSPAYLTVKEASAILRVSPQSLYAAIADGTFPAVRVGRALRVSLRAVEPSVTPIPETEPRQASPGFDKDKK